MKKLIPLLIVLTLIAALFPVSARAAGNTITLHDGDVLELYGFWTPEMDVITIASGAVATITADEGTEFTDIKIFCAGSCHLILDNVKIINSSAGAYCIALADLTHSTLELRHQNTLIGGQYRPAVQVNSSQELDITGNGSLWAVGGENAAGIGSSDRANCGTITIKDTVWVYAQSGELGAGIGGGNSGNGGTINIEGNPHVEAYGYISGIGGGRANRGGYVNILGGWVLASGMEGPGIGGDNNLESDYPISITGGIVFAMTYGHTHDGDILQGLQYDIGRPNNTHEITISGDAAVFLYKNTIGPAPTTSHTHLPFTRFYDNKIYGYETHEAQDWGGAGAYLPNVRGIIKYLPYGDSGTKHYEAIFYNSFNVLRTGNEFYKEYQRVASWNTQSDGLGTSYVPGDGYAFDQDLLTLYALWEPIPVTGITLNRQELSLLPQKTATLTASVTPDTANPEGVVWSSSHEAVATVTQEGVVKGVAVGHSTVTAELNGKTATCEVEIRPYISELSFELSMFLNDKVSLIPLLQPDNSSPEDLTWESSDEDILTVDEDGTVTATGIGTAVISGITEYFVQCDFKITVVEKPLLRVFFAPDTLTINVGDLITLEPFVSPDNYLYEDVEWAASDSDKASVNSYGMVNAKAPGEVTISATIDGVTGECAININAPVTTVELTPRTAQLYGIGATLELAGKVWPEDAQDQTIIWTSTDTDVASVTQDGKVTSRGIGTTVIHAECGGEEDTCTITVSKQPVASLTLNESEKSLHISEVFNLDAAIQPDNATNKSVTWKSSDEDVALVDKNGTVQAVGLGSCDITAESVDDPSIAASCSVEVTAKDVQSISLNLSEMEIFPGDAFTLKATVSPPDATCPDITWESSDTYVAVVDENGGVKAVGLGTCDITAVSDDNPNIFTSCTVDVIAKDVDSISINPDEKEVFLGESFTLKATVSPTDATYSKITWQSSDEKVAIADENGGVQALGLGTCDISAVSDDDPTIFASCTVNVNAIDVESVSIDIDEKELVLGESFTLKGTVSPKNATYPDITWSSSDSDIAQVDENGGVQAVGLGACAINAESGGKSAQCSITVSKVAVSSVSLNRTSNTLYEGEWFALNADIKPFDATYPFVSWSSSDSSVAIVSSAGVVQAKDPGSCVIRASADGVSAECEVMVKKVPIVGVNSVKIAINTNTVTILHVGDTVDLVANVYPSNAYDHSLTWQSSDISVATVTSSGHVKAMSVGKAQITVTASGHSDAYNLVVRERTDSEASPAPSGSAESPDAQVTPTAQMQMVTIVHFDTDTLPDGTKYMLLPCGEIVEVTGGGIMRINVPCDDVDADGNIGFVALNDERVPLGSVKVDTKGSTDEKKITNVLLILLIALGTLIVGAAGALVFVRVASNKR